MKPVRNHTLSVHEVTDCLQHCLEVVLLRLPTENDVERLVDVLWCVSITTMATTHTHISVCPLTHNDWHNTNYPLTEE